MKRAVIYKEIDCERRAQNKKWGGHRHDDSHSYLDWVGYIVKHARCGEVFEEHRKQMIRRCGTRGSCH